ncbi:MAG: hypothetical protein HFH26_14970 [Clostridiaceae bacterium]|nr:hypothetical protein [Clostridiaceae bacterium]
MNKDVRCPCCGLRLKEAVESCSQCGLTGLNQIFLDRDSCRRWEQEVLIPCKRSWEAKLAKERRRAEERRHAAQRKKAQQLAGRSNRLIFKDDHRLLILMKNGRLYGMGDNCDGSLGNVGTTWVGDPQLLAKNARSAAVSRNYTIYITEDGCVHLLGNGEYVDRFPRFNNAQEVSVRGNVFFIRASNGKWYGFGDNGDERITKRTKQTMCRFQEIPYDYRAGVGTSRGPMNHHERELFRGDVSPIYRLVRATNEYRNLCEKYGGANIRIANVVKRPIEGWGEDYFYNEKGIGSAEVVLENQHIYVPVETKPRLDNAVEIDSGYFGGNFAGDPDFWWEKESGKVFLALQDEAHGFEMKKHRLITAGVREMFTVCTHLKRTRYEVVLSMNDGRILFGDVDTFSKDWDIGRLKVLKP